MESFADIYKLCLVSREDNDLSFEDDSFEEFHDIFETETIEKDLEAEIGKGEEFCSGHLNSHKLSCFMLGLFWGDSGDLYEELLCLGLEIV